MAIIGNVRESAWQSQAMCQLTLGNFMTITEYKIT